MRPPEAPVPSHRLKPEASARPAGPEGPKNGMAAAKTRFDGIIARLKERVGKSGGRDALETLADASDTGIETPNSDATIAVTADGQRVPQDNQSVGIADDPKDLDVIDGRPNRTRKISQEMPLQWRMVKDSLISEFPQTSIEGLNTGRVEDFIRQAGLEVKPYIIFDRNELPRVKKIVGETRLLRSHFDTGGEGLYSPEMDLVLIARNRDAEKMSGAIYTEGILVHELAHASSGYQEYVIDDKGVYAPRAGFALAQDEGGRGTFLEEGWADMHRGEYVGLHASTNERTMLENALAYGRLHPNDTAPLITRSGETMPLPIKYFYIMPDRTVVTKTSAYAGYGLELLCKQNPTLRPLLIEGRKSVEGLQNMAKTLDSISPGLYSRLQKGDYERDSFLDKLSFIITDVAGGLEGTIQAEGPLKKKWTKLLKK